MKIKKLKKKNLVYRFYKFYFFFSIVIIFISVLAFLNLGLWQNYKDEITKRIYLNGISNYKYLPNIFSLVLKNSFSKLDNFNLEINQKNIIKIESNRKEKLEDPKNEFISAVANIKLNGDLIKTNIRLKGDREIHYENKDKSSYKFNLKKNFAYKSLTSFSIQKPRIRNYIHEWIFHEMAKDLGLISLKYDFVNLIINGENKGLFVLEESFSNTLIEKNNRRAGPIFGLNEEFEMNNFFSANFDPYQVKYWNRPENKELFLVAKNKLKKLQTKNFQLKDIIDIKKWSDYFVLCDLLYTHHGLLPKSVKFYYNPISGLFEPIPFDGHKMPAYDFSPKIEKFFDHSSSFDIAKKISFNSNLDRSFTEWLRLFFFKNNGDLNEDFYFSYRESLKRITEEKYLNGFFKKHKNYIDKINSKIYLDDFQFDYDTERKKGLGIYYFNFNKINERAKKLLEINKIAHNELIFEDKADKVEIINKNYNNNNLIVNEIFCSLNSDEQISINLEKFNHQIKFNKSYINKSKYDLINKNCSKIVLFDKLYKKKYIKQIDQNLFTENKSVSQNNFLKYFIKKQNKLYFKNKETVIDKNIYIPSGFNIIVNPNQVIRIINKAVIFSKSNWNFNGQQNKPILISGYEDDFGGGLFIQSREKNFVNHVKIQFLDGPQINSKNNNFNNLNSLRIYGALNFYKTYVEIVNLDCSNISSEDALNLINSKFFIKNSIFSNINSDAIDFDFSNGKIDNIKFNNIFNDALDFSGSNVKIKNITANNVVDKVISAGENSNLEIDNLNLKNSFIGIANKDGSILKVKNSFFQNVRMPLAGYLKKNFYRKGFMHVTNSVFNNFDNKFILSKESSIYIDGEKLTTNKKNKQILDIIYK